MSRRTATVIQRPAPEERLVMQRKADRREKQWNEEQPVKQRNTDRQKIEARKKEWWKEETAFSYD